MFYEEPKYQKRRKSFSEIFLKALFLFIIFAGVYALIKTKASTKCEFVFIDGGSNRGDTIEWFSGNKEKADSKRVIRMTCHVFQFPCEMIEMKKKIMSKYDTSISDFCVYGFEGNSYFSKTLKAKVEEKRALFKQVEVFTETVISHVSTPLKFYIDDFNKKHHFFGSSLSQDHSDATKGSNCFY